MARFTLSAVVGVIAGFATGNPGIGFQAFAVTYGLAAGLDPNQKVNAPYPDLSRVPGANYGDPLPYVIGVARVPGVVTWASEKRAIATTTTTGKGPSGVDSTTYTTVVDVFYLLTANEMAALRRVWSYGKLVWSQAEDADETTLSDSASTDAWERITFYTGAANQLPDPDMEAFFGVGNTPAYRHRSGVFIKSLVCAGGDQLPLLNFEVLQAASPGGGSFEMGNLPSNDYPRSGPIFVDASGVTMHIRTYVTPYTPGDVDVIRLNPNGTTSGLGEYTAVSGSNFAVGEVNSDVPVAISLRSGVSTYALFHSDGSGFDFTIPDTSSRFSAAYKSGILYVGNKAGTAQQVWRFNGATLTHTSVVLGDIQSIATNGVGVYALESGGANVFVLDPGNLTLLDTIATPVSAVSAVVLADVDGSIYYAANPSGTGSLYRLSGTTWTLANPDVGDAAPDDQMSGTVTDRMFILNGALYRSVTIDGATTVNRSASTVAIDTIELDDVVRDIYLRTGLLTEDDFDVTAYEGKFVRGLSVNQVTTSRAVLEILQSGHLVTITEGDKLTGGNRGTAPVETIQYEDMGASESDPISEPLPIRRINDIEQAARVTIKYINAINDYQTGAEAGERLITESKSDAVTELALALTPGEAKKLADVATMDIAVGMLSIGPVNVTRKYAHLEVNDVVLLVNSDGSTYRVRITKITDSGLIRTLECVLDDATIINSAAATDEDYTSTTLVRNSSPTETELFDGPILRDADNDAGFYVLQNGGEKWPGGTLRVMPDGTTISTITERAIFGTCSTTLGDWTGPRVFDEVNTVTVNVGTGELSSSTRDAVLNDQSVNAFAIGVDGRWELGQFKTASLISPGVYILSGLLRGSRGTEWAMTGHTSGETFLLLQARGMRRAPMETGLLGTERTYRGVTLGRQIDTADDIAFTNMGVGLKPFSPFDLRASRDSGDITLTWQRRSRLSTRAIGPLGISVPLGESVEAYSIDIYDDNTYTTVVRNLTSTTASVEYSAADQTTDFGSPQATVYVGVYQLSAQVGRGTELQAAA